MSSSSSSSSKSPTLAHCNEQDCKGVPVFPQELPAFCEQCSKCPSCKQKTRKFKSHPRWDSDGLLVIFPTLHKKCARCIYFAAKRKRDEEEQSQTPLDLLVQAVASVKDSTETLRKERDEINVQYTALEGQHHQAQLELGELRGEVMSLTCRLNDLTAKHEEVTKKCK